MCCGVRIKNRGPQAKYCHGCKRKQQVRTVRAWQLREPGKVAEYEARPEVLERRRLRASQNRLGDRYKKWREKYKDRPDLRIKERLRNAKRRLLIKQGDAITSKFILHLLYIQENYCDKCGCDIGDGNYHIDHYNPLCNGGPHSEENLRLLCPRCNLSKGGFVPDDVKIAEI